MLGQGQHARMLAGAVVVNGAGLLPPFCQCRLVLHALWPVGPAFIGRFRNASFLQHGGCHAGVLRLTIVG